MKKVERDAMGRRKAVWTKARRLKAAEHMRQVNKNRTWEKNHRDEAVSGAESVVQTVEADSPVQQVIEMLIARRDDLNRMIEFLYTYKW